MSAQRKSYVTPQEYLEMERAADYKSEYFAGEIYAMAGASPRHVMIVTNTAAAFVGRLRSKECYTYSSDLRLLVSPAGLYTYPDIVVVCGKPLYDDAREDTLLNPSLIVEVLSPSTEAYDRGAKFSQYRKLESLTDYLLISQDRALVEHYVPQPTADAASDPSVSKWLLTAYQGTGNTVTISSIGIELPLDEIYDKVEWSQDEAGAATLKVVKEQGNGYTAETR